MKKQNLLYILIAIISVTAACKEKAPPPPPACSNVCQATEQRTDYPDCKCFTPAPPDPIEPDLQLQAQLINAAISGNVQFIKQQLDKYIDINAPLSVETIENFINFREGLKRNDFLYNNIKSESNDLTLLALSVAVDKKTVFDELIKRKVNVNVPGFSGYTPVEIAIINSDAEKAKILMANGATGDFFSGQNNYLTNALKNKRFPIAQVLVEYANANEIDIKDSLPSITKAIEEGNTNLVTFLLASTNIDSNYKDPQTGRYLIASAVVSGNKDLIKTISAAGSSLNIQDEDGRTPLMILIEESAKKKSSNNKSLLDLIKFVIDNGAEISLKNKKGETALFYAVRSGNIDVLKLLITNGADINAKDNQGQTAIFIPADNGNITMTKLLIESGALKKVKNKRGVTPATLAVQRGDMDIFDLLEK